MTRAQALASGLTASQLRNVGVGHPHRDVYLLDGPARELAERCAAAATRLRDLAVFSDGTAAALWLFPLRLRRVDSPRLDVTVPPYLTVPAIKGVRGHARRLPPSHVTTLGRIPVTTAARTLLDLAAVLSADELVIATDAALAARSSSLPELRELEAWAGRRRGVQRLRDALDLANPDSRSPKESELRLLLVRSGLPAPEANAHVHDEGGWIATADLLYRSHRLVIEYDGRDHGREDRRIADLRRRNLLERAGYFVLTYSSGDLRRPWSVSADVRHAFAVQSTRLGVANPLAS
jgi:hypothetical protein